MSEPFKSIKRQEFREYFQPSRIILAVIPSDNKSGCNITTLCFAAHSAYKPPSICFAIERRHEAHRLLQLTKKLVIAVPGPGLAHAALYCGTNSGRDNDKAEELGLDVSLSSPAGLPMIASANSNLEACVLSQTPSGDHTLFNVGIENYLVREKNIIEPCLLSVARNHAGYRILAQQGIHRIAIPDV
ncbi:MAG: flavin reductase [Hyphomonadaceae bacterium]|nr:flavin reductase [Hyphomonadaceae bacterium]